MTQGPVLYDPSTDTMLVELRDWPVECRSDALAGGEDVEEDLVVHYAPDGEPWAWEIEHASRHADLVARALLELRARSGLQAA